MTVISPQIIHCTVSCKRSFQISTRYFDEIWYSWENGLWIFGVKPLDLYIFSIYNFKISTLNVAT